jgi:capsular polysaccharide transport system ATP-binding protein
MIVIRSMSRIFQDGKETHTVFDDVNVDLPTDRHCAILGGGGSGKSLLLRILAGVEEPTFGETFRYANLSFPVGYQRALRPSLTVRQNIEFAASLYGAHPDEVLTFVDEVTGFGQQFDEPLRRMHDRSRTMLAYALSYAIPFDTYLIDEHIARGLPEFHEICFAMFAHRAQEAGILLATRDVKKALDYCDTAAVILAGKVLYFEDIQEAVGVYLDQQARHAVMRGGVRDSGSGVIAEAR